VCRKERKSHYLTPLDSNSDVILDLNISAVLIGKVDGGTTPLNLFNRYLLAPILTDSPLFLAKSEKLVIGYDIEPEILFIVARISFPVGTKSNHIRRL
jgi:hypothetical protein